MNTTPTPRTDANKIAVAKVLWESENSPNELVDADFARQLERELAEARDNWSLWKKRYDEMIVTCKYECDQRDKLKGEFAEVLAKLNDPVAVHVNKENGNDKTKP